MFSRTSLINARKSTLRQFRQPGQYISAMGYMGFGMKKEVYSKKPKRAFQRIIHRFGKRRFPIKQQAPRKATCHPHKKAFPLPQRKNNHLKTSLAILTALIITGVLFYAVFSAIVRYS